MYLYIVCEKSAKASATQGTRARRLPCLVHDATCVCPYHRSSSRSGAIRAPPAAVMPPRGTRSPYAGVGAREEKRGRGASVLSVWEVVAFSERMQAQGRGETGFRGAAARSVPCRDGQECSLSPTAVGESEALCREKPGRSSGDTQVWKIEVLKCGNGKTWCMRRRALRLLGRTRFQPED